MKKVISLLLVFILNLSIFVLCFNVKNVNAEESESNENLIEVAEVNNLANWEYDWNTVEIGAGKTSFDSGNLTMENINLATANYALYQTNKFNEFRMDMYANLYLPSPSDFEIEGNDWCNLYVTFFIDFEDAKQVENVAQAACPWTMNKGHFSVCFERIGGNSCCQLLINETFDGAGSNRYFLKSGPAKTDWCDNEYHWFSIVTKATRSKNPARPRPEEEGITISVYIDGVEQFSYYQSNVYYSNTNLQEEVIPFSTQKGYLGLWASSSFASNYVTENTGVKCDIKKLQITSYDDLEDPTLATPYERCARPEVKLDPVLNYSPQAYYETGEELEIKLSELFEYDGTEKLTYTSSIKGEPFGTIRNGYFVWTPDEAGTYTIHFTATDGEKEASNDVRLRVREPEVDPNKTTKVDEPTTVKTDEEPISDEQDSSNKKSGCKGGIALSILSILPVMGAVVLYKRKERL